jgi:hypothetical protein
MPAKVAPVNTGPAGFSFPKALAAPESQASTI